MSDKNWMLLVIVTLFICIQVFSLSFLAVSS
jgi:capsular polysaccharide biosynthesis protein